MLFLGWNSKVKDNCLLYLSCPMPNSSSPAIASDLTQADVLQQLSATELAQLLLEKLTIMDGDWHRLKANRNARASELVAAGLVFLLKDQPQEALPRFQQAVGWLDRSVSAPACESHGDHEHHHGPHHGPHRGKS
jgi:hypothetical protein